jgi:uncharacterized protein YkuJ
MDNDDEKRELLKEMELLVKSVSHLKIQIQELINKNSELKKTRLFFRRGQNFLKVIYMNDDEKKTYFKRNNNSNAI